MGFDPGIGKIPWRRKWQPPPVFLPGKSHGQSSLVGYSSWVWKETETTEGLSTLLDTDVGTHWSQLRHILRGNTNFKAQSFISTLVKIKIKTWAYLWENIYLKHFYHQDELSKEITEHFSWIFYNHFNTWYLNQILRNPCMFHPLSSMNLTIEMV